MVSKEDNSAVTYDTLSLANEIHPGLYHSRFALHDYYFTDWLDLFSIGEKDEGALFIDVGLEELCGTYPLDSVIKKVGVPYRDAKVFITHFHDDHDGNLPYCVKQGVESIFHGPLVPYSDERLHRFMQATGINNVGDKALQGTTEFLMGKDRITPQVQEKLIEVHTGEVLTLGNHSLEVLQTPGHAPEHISLIDKERKIMFAGDHLLNSPAGLLQLDPGTHLVKEYLESLEQIRSLDLNVAYLSHADPLIGAEAIATFVDHAREKYEKPLIKVEKIVKENDGMSVYEVAQDYYSYLKGGGLEGQPDRLRMRRIAIMLSFLDYLFDIGKIKREESDEDVLLYH